MSDELTPCDQEEKISRMEYLLIEYKRKKQDFDFHKEDLKHTRNLIGKEMENISSSFSRFTTSDAKWEIVNVEGITSICYEDANGKVMW